MFFIFNFKGTFSTFLTLVGPPWYNLEIAPLAVLHLNNQLHMHVCVCNASRVGNEIRIKHLSEKSSSDEPEWVGDWELILHDVVLSVAGVRVVPLVRWEPGHHKQGEANQDVGGQHIP